MRSSGRRSAGRGSTCTGSRTAGAGSGDPSRDDGYFGGGYSDEEDAVLGKVARGEGTVLTYVYDFGDDWCHRIEVEKVLLADPAVSYPVCTGGRRAAPPAEDIGGVWGLNEIVSLVAHPEEEVPEHWEDLVGHLRETGWDPAAFDQAELNKALAEFPAPEPASSRKRVAALTEDDLAYCTCGQCQAGDPVRSADGGYLPEDDDDENDIEVFRLVEAPSAAELAAAIRAGPRAHRGVRYPAGTLRQRLLLDPRSRRRRTDRLPRRRRTAVCRPRLARADRPRRAQALPAADRPAPRLRAVKPCASCG